MKRAQDYLYAQTLERIRGKIQRGEFLPGDCLPSIAEIQQNFNVSRNTAIRVINELQREGLAVKRKGKGTFLRKVITSASFNVPQYAPPAIQRVLFLSESPAVMNCAFPRRILESVMARVASLKMDFRMEHWYAAPAAKRAYMLPVEPAPGEGAIIYYTGDLNLLLLQDMLEKGCPCVLVDGVFPDCGSVLTDNDYGLTLLVNHLYELGHRHVAFAGRFTSPGCVFNATERMEAFVRATASRGMRGDVLAETTFFDLLRTLRATRRPSALIFSQDIGAINAWRFLTSHGIRVPEDISLCGFDDYIAGGRPTEHLTTVRVDADGLGRAAVDLLAEMPAAGASMLYWRRVKPQLIVRESVASC
ncbi:MAG: substrate-binding domain-containing protein [Kiritimatiellia bacterium]|jgi:GntR family transcriptional regulator of arabinose operon